MNKEAFQSFFKSENHPYLLSVSHDDIQDHFTFSFCDKEWHWMYGDVNYPQGLENERTTIIRDFYKNVRWRGYPKFHFIFMKGDFNFLKNFSNYLPKMMNLECKVTWHMNDSTEDLEKQFSEHLKKLRVMPINTENNPIPMYRNIRLGTTYF